MINIIIIIITPTMLIITILLIYDYCKNITACRKEAEASFDLPLTGPYRLEGSTFRV